MPKLDWRVVFNRAAPPGVRGWGRVRAAQLVEMRPAMKVAAWGQTFNALFIVYMLGGRRRRPSTLALWLFSLVAADALFRPAAGASCAAARSTRCRARRSTAPPITAIFFGLVWAFPARYFFEHADHGQQLALCVITATMMAGAAFVFSPIPAAAAAYVLIMGVAATRMLMTTDSPADHR